MAQNQQTVTVGTAWTQLTNADVTNITFAVISGDVFIRFTTDATQPTEDHGIPYYEGSGEANRALSDLTSLSGADRVWAKVNPYGPNREPRAAVYVDHA